MTPTTLATSDFDYVRALVRERSAIVLEPGKEYLVQTRLQPVAQRNGLADIGALVDRLRRGEPALATQVVEAMTTNETSFFRDAHPFEMLRTDVIPTLMESRKTQRALRIWSAASSTGQEAYTIAMTLRESFPQLAGWAVSILGTDLSRDVVEKAKEGRYAQIEVNRGLPAPLLLKYFERAGLAWKVKQELRRAVEFKQMNLIAPWPSIPRMDVVFLRNVLIYFDGDTKRAILANVRRVIAPDGYLFLGAAESTLQYDRTFERIQTARTNCYRLLQNS
ncbi:MAG: protein-glutamate O-methyltransferase CheR [Actinomycetia bacterium]|nr:protein-glutamate O-methyltransferase CheR [Actinomycetes bacterium]